jgi:hypothetical protein
MSRSGRGEAAKLLQRLCSDAGARLVRDGAGKYALEIGGAEQALPELQKAARLLVATGVVEEREPGRCAVGAVAKAWLKRQERPDLPFRAQHGAIAMVAGPDGGERLLADLDESPVAALARRGGTKSAFLAPHAVAAAERLRRDFEIGRLQPRVTANWSASVATGRRAEGGKGLLDLTDMALAARTRFNEAVAAVGPELSGALVDVCCFLKGLETVERERQWPARSAKLVLRLALEGLARHYGLAPAAEGRPRDGRVRHWGAADYRPEIS